MEVFLMLSDRKRMLIQWANKNKGEGVPWYSLRMQKFLFFYECFSKIEGDTYCFDYLKGYRNGPVFSDVYQAMTYYADSLPKNDEVIDYAIDEERAVRAIFLVRILGNELSEFTHNLDIWKAKKEEIITGGYQIPLHDTDFSANDEKIFTNLLSMYSISQINSVKLIETNGKTFIVPKDLEITEQYLDVFYSVAPDDIFRSPIYVSVHEGELCLE